MTCGLRACLGALLLTLATLAVSAASPKRVLILDPFGRDVAPFSSAISAFRTTLAREFGEPVDFHEVPLDLARFAGQDEEDPLVAFLAGRINSRPVDLVVPIGGAGVQFAARHRERLFPDTPMLVVAGDPRFVPSGFLQTNATLVTQGVSLAGMVEDILQLQPRTTNIAVVFGASALERYWIDECRREFQAFTNRVGFTWLNDLPFEQVLDRCASLPPRSFILHGLFVVDAAGVPCERNEALRRLHEVANAPLFGYFASEFGLGSIGGRLYQDVEVGARGARVAIRILRGERPEGIPPQILDTTDPVYDWRELRRWGISESALPAGRVIEFREPGFWEQYRWPIAGTAMVSLFQAALIVGLLLNRGKRRRGEAEAGLIADISSMFVNLPPNQVERKIMDAERRVCEFLALDLAALWQWSDEAPGSLMLTHFYRAGDGLQPPEQMNAGEFFPWSQEHMRSGRTLAIASLDELPAEAARDRENYARFGVKSTLVIPLSMGGEPPIGALGFNSTRAERRWPDVLVKRLQLVAQIFTNALARKRADQALRESEERLSLAADSAEAGLWVLDCHTQIFWATEKSRLLFGYTPEEVIDMERFKVSVHPEDWDGVRRGLERSLTTGEPVNLEYRIRLANGPERWIASRGRPSFTSAGEPDRLLGLSIDITDRKRAEEAFRRSEARLAAGTELAGLGYYEVDYAEQTCFVDDRFREICGIPAELAQSFQAVEFWLKHVHADDLPLIARERQKLHGGIVDQNSVEYRYQHPACGLRWLHHSARVAGRRAGGDQIRTFGVIRDITQQKRAEQEAHELRNNLTHLTRVNTLGALSGSLAHELNQPLGIILSNAQAAQELLAQQPPDLAEVQAILADIVAADHRAGDVIERLRSLLKHGQVSLQPLALKQVIEEVLQLTQADLIGRGISLVRELVPDLPPIAGDRVQLQQLVLNLILNAADAMAANAPGTRRLHLQTRLHDGRVRATMRDEGTGLPADAERLFEPFYTTKTHGLGLGLSICRSIVAAHHGRIWAEPHPERGAVFHFELPVAEVGKSDQ